MVASQKLRVPFEWSHNEDYSIMGSILGSPVLGNYHILSDVQGHKGFW